MPLEGGIVSKNGILFSRDQLRVEIRGKIKVVEYLFFLVLWLQYFSVFSVLRFPGECEAAKNCTLTMGWPYWIKAVMTYGVWVPFLVSFMKSFLVRFHGAGDFIKDLIISSFVYMVIVLLPEFLFGYDVFRGLVLYVFLGFPFVVLGSVFGLVADFIFGYMNGWRFLWRR